MEESPRMRASERQRASGHKRPAWPGNAAKWFASRVAFAGFVSLVGVFFALPMLWLVFAPFNSTATLAAKPSRPTLDNFHQVFVERDDVPRALGISALLVIGTVAIVVAVGSPAAYALSRLRFPGRDFLLYLLLLLSSVVAGSAAILPLYLLLFELDMIDTYRGVWLALAGGLLPAAMFILKDFTDSIPRSYEESARVFGASSFQALRHIVIPVIRPGLAVISVWTAVQVWGNFLLPFIIFGGPGRRPAAVLMYTFQDEGGGADLGPLAAFALVYTIPILLLYWFVNKRYGFRFHGGIKR
jgi:multiple sugar transport system permease protein